MSVHSDISQSAAPYVAMAQNNAWANAVLYAAISNLPDTNAFHAARPGFFPSLHQTLAHIWQVDLYYIDALQGSGAGYHVFDQDVPQACAALAQAQADSDDKLVAFCGTLTDAALAKSCKTQRPEGLMTERVDAVLLHLFQHQIHHRGQAHVQLQTTGTAPPQLDEFHLIYDRAPSAAKYRNNTPTIPT